MNRIKPQTNWLDRAILSFAPRWGAQRVINRTSFKAWMEGAANDRLRGHEWNTQRLSTDAGLEDNLEATRDRSWDLYRNDSMVHGLVEGRVTAIIGRGFRPQSQIDHEDSGISEQFAAELDAAIEKVFTRWCPYSDPTAAVDFTAQLQQIQRSWDVHGEAFVEFTNSSNSVDKEIPLAVRVIPPTMVETPPSMAGNPRVRMGIEYDAKGRRIAFWVRHAEPGDNKTFVEQWRRVPARFSNGNVRVVHLFDQQFPRQSRGWPLVAPVLGVFKDIKDLNEAAITREQIISCFAVFISGESDGLTRASNAAVESDSNGRLIEEVSPGQVIRHRPGEEVKFANPQTPQSNFEPFIKMHQHLAAAGVQWPVSWLTGDYRNFNYSAGRLEAIAGVETIRVRQQRLMAGFLRHLWAQVWEQARFVGLVEVPETLFNDNRAAILNHRWIAPGRPYIDPEKEIKAAKLAIEMNLTTKSDVAQSVYGVDWFDDVAPQRQREKQRETELDIEVAMQPEPGSNQQPAKKDDNSVEQKSLSHVYS